MLPSHAALQAASSVFLESQVAELSTLVEELQTALQRAELKLEKQVWEGEGGHPTLLSAHCRSLHALRIQRLPDAVTIHTPPSPSSTM